MQNNLQVGFKAKSGIETHFGLTWLLPCVDANAVWTFFVGRMCDKLARKNGNSIFSTGLTSGTAFKSDVRAWSTLSSHLKLA